MMMVLLQHHHYQRYTQDRQHFIGSASSRQDQTHSYLLVAVTVQVQCRCLHLHEPEVAEPRHLDVGSPLHRANNATHSQHLLGRYHLINLPSSTIVERTYFRQALPCLYVEPDIELFTGSITPKNPVGVMLGCCTAQRALQWSLLTGSIKHMYATLTFTQPSKLDCAARRSAGTLHPTASSQIPGPYPKTNCPPDPARSSVLLNPPTLRTPPPPHTHTHILNEASPPHYPVFPPAGAIMSTLPATYNIRVLLHCRG